MKRRLSRAMETMGCSSRDFDSRRNGARQKQADGYGRLQDKEVLGHDFGRNMGRSAGEPRKILRCLLFAGTRLARTMTSETAQIHAATQ